MQNVDTILGLGKVSLIKRKLKWSSKGDGAGSDTPP